MSRLESFIRRLTAQRDILDMICSDMKLGDGPVVELGLGNGRTYDHLRERLPGRRIIAFDRVNAANLKSLPPEGDLILDNRTSRIKDWSRTPYRYFARQAQGNGAKWQRIGGAVAAEAGKTARTDQGAF